MCWTRAAAGLAEGTIRHPRRVIPPNRLKRAGLDAFSAADTRVSTGIAATYPDSSDPNNAPMSTAVNLQALLADDALWNNRRCVLIDLLLVSDSDISNLTLPDRDCYDYVINVPK